jgi:hypothetical protein
VVAACALDPIIDLPKLARYVEKFRPFRLRPRRLCSAGIGRPNSTSSNVFQVDQLLLFEFQMEYL